MRMRRGDLPGTCMALSNGRLHYQKVSSLCRNAIGHKEPIALRLVSITLWNHLTPTKFEVKK